MKINCYQPFYISDFLPFKCDACNSIFCKDHFDYDKHLCKYAFMKNKRVPLCPLCNQPVPAKQGEPYDIKVNQHIENDCKENPVLKKKQAVYKNFCTFSRCKQKEMIPIICHLCKRNFCLKHRHPIDHNCNGRDDKNKNNTQQTFKIDTTALSFKDKMTLNNKHMVDVQGHFTEDEALALALEQSLNDAQSTSNDQKSIFLSQSHQNTSKRSQSNREKCLLS